MGYAAVMAGVDTAHPDIVHLLFGVTALGSAAALFVENLEQLQGRRDEQAQAAAAKRDD